MAQGLASSYRYTREGLIISGEYSVSAIVRAYGAGAFRWLELLALAMQREDVAALEQSTGFTYTFPDGAAISTVPLEVTTEAQAFLPLEVVYRKTMLPETFPGLAQVTLSGDINLTVPEGDP
jgi:hypothetical protein